MAKVKSLPKAPKFDPAKSYRWKEEDEFVLTGVQFDKLYHYTKHMNERGPLGAAQVMDMMQILHSLFLEGVEVGAIVEFVPEEPTPTAPAVTEEVKEETKE